MADKNDPLNDVYSDLVDAVNTLDSLPFLNDSTSLMVEAWLAKLESVMGEIMKFQSMLTPEQMAERWDK